MKLFRFLAYCFAFFLGAVFAFRGGNSFPAPPPKQYRPAPVTRVSQVIDAVDQSDVSTEIQAGKNLFIANCATCHHRNMRDNLTGPALGEASENWSEYPEADLYNWIRNSQAMIAGGHPRALELWNTWQPVIMPAFPNLSDEEIDTLLAYMDAVYSS